MNKINWSGIISLKVKFSASIFVKSYMLVLSVPPPPNIKRVWINIYSFLIHQTVKKIKKKKLQKMKSNKIPKIKKITEKTEDLSHMLIWCPMPDLASVWCNHLNQSNNKSKNKTSTSQCWSFAGNLMIIFLIICFKIPIPVMDIVNLWLFKFFYA